MIKKQKTIRELIQRQQEISTRIEEIANLCEQENRERNESEAAEYAKLVRDQSIIDMKLRALQTPLLPAQEVSATRQFRDAAQSGARKVELVLTRDVELMKSTATADTGIIPIKEEEMLKPLREGLIWDKVGLKITTGHTAQTLRWPKHGKGTAQWAEEGERAEDDKIDFSKLTTQPHRLVHAIPVTNEALESSEGVVEGVIREEMPAAVIDLINDALFTTDKNFVPKGGGSKARVVYGPFVKAAENPFEFAAEVPTRKELLKMKAKVTKTGIKLVAPCWVMTEDMKAELEDAKVDAGSGRFVCENDHILGYPVFTTSAIGEGNIGFGDWVYQAGGFFGPISLITDPYTLLRQNSVDFVLNAHFATVTLYEEAFVLGKKKA